MKTREGGRERRRNWAEKGLLSSSPSFLKSVLFYGLCALLDEIATFSILALGGREMNPRLAFTLETNPLLWPLMDTALLLYFLAIWRIVKLKGLCLLPLGAGSARLLFFLWNVMQILLWLVRK